MGQTAVKNNAIQGLYRFIDRKQPEVKWALSMSVTLIIFFIAFSLYDNFSIYESVICNLIECMISGLIGLIGVAIAGIAIVIALFTSEQICLINQLKENAFDRLLYDFKWFALISAIETAVFIGMISVIRSPYPIAPRYAFYLIAFILVYGVFYLLFYACALIGNFIKLSHLKCSLDTILNETKNIPMSAIELQLDFLISRLFKGDRVAAKEFYNELVACIEKGTAKNKDEIIEYIKKRYLTI